MHVIRSRVVEPAARAEHRDGGRRFALDALDLLGGRNATGQAHDCEHELVDCRLTGEHKARGRRRCLAVRWRTQPAVPRVHIPRRRYPDRRSDLRPQRALRDAPHTGPPRRAGPRARVGGRERSHRHRLRVGPHWTGPQVPGCPHLGLWSVDSRVRRPEDACVTFNLADMFERVVDAVPDREVLVTPTRRLTFRELDARANRLAHHLADAGIRARRSRRAAVD